MRRINNFIVDALLGNSPSWYKPSQSNNSKWHTINNYLASKTHLMFSRYYSSVLIWYDLKESEGSLRDTFRVMLSQNLA
jgi:hypothetical protein